MIKKDSNNNNVYDNSMITTDILLPWYYDNKNNYGDNSICNETTNDDGMGKKMKTKVKIFVAPVSGVTWKKN